MQSPYTGDGGAINVLAKVKMDQNEGSARSAVLLRGSGTTAYSGYMLLLNRNSGGTGNADALSLRRYDAGGSASVVEDAAISINTSDWHWLKLQADGGSLRGKVWAVGVSEPASWTVEIVDATYESGWAGVACRSIGRTFDFAGFRVAAMRDGAVSGVVTDVAAENVARVVRAYDRDTGELIGETTSDETTGAYTITVPAGREIDRIVLAEDDSTPLYNDLIDRVIPA
tara:strand:+ start:621 stop:1304 length:684 start_codon:yes stop_codon:yes gene_type:complete